jgi:hypothetical protein
VSEPAVDTMHGGGVEEGVFGVPVGIRPGHGRQGLPYGRWAGAILEAVMVMRRPPGISWYDGGLQEGQCP